MTILLNQKIFQRYFQVANSDLGHDVEIASNIGNVISNNNSVLVGFSEFCLMPKMRNTQINFAIINRWLSSVPSYLVLSDIFSGSRIKPEKIKYFSAQTIENLFDVTFEIGVEHFKLRDASSNELANCVTKSASATFAFYQRSNLPESYTLRQHTKLLRSFIDEALPFIIAANALVTNPNFDRYG
ncbi:MAG: hypothetical protein ABW104_19745 [Candidatus Thiodiazotropha sp. 6PLUC2]